MLRFYRSGWFLVVKLLLMLLSFVFIYYHVNQEEVFDRLLLIGNEVKNNVHTRILFTGVGVLMIINWTLEAVKWKLITGVFFQLSMLQSFRAVLSGIAISFITPNRSGDFVGRVLHLPAGFRIEGALFSIVGSLSQLLITLTAGTASLFLLVKTFKEWNDSTRALIYISCILLVLVLHFLLINFNKYLHLLERLPLPQRIQSRFKMLHDISPMLLAKTYLLSFSRYCVFAFQFFLLLKVFGINLPADTMIILINASFLLITIIPSFALTEIGVRGSIAVFLFSNYTADTTGVILATTSLWLINIVFPALLGVFSMLYLKLNK